MPWNSPFQKRRNPPLQKRGNSPSGSGRHWTRSLTIVPDVLGGTILLCGWIRSRSSYPIAFLPNQLFGACGESNPLPRFCSPHYNLASVTPCCHYPLSRFPVRCMVVLKALFTPTVELHGFQLYGPNLLVEDLPLSPPALRPLVEILCW